MAKAKERVSEARPYIERALKDKELRDNVRNAFEAARDVYAELLGGRTPTALATRVATDKDIQDNMRTAIEELRSAADRLQGKEGHKTRNTMLLLTGIALGILFNPATGPQTRKWLADRLFGSDEDFTYQGGDGGAGT
jgi:hypothetical protein